MRILKRMQPKEEEEERESKMKRGRRKKHTVLLDSIAGTISTSVTFLFNKFNNGSYSMDIHIQKLENLRRNVYAKKL